MRIVSARLRVLLSEVADWIGPEGAFLIVAIATLAYGAGLFDPRLPWIVVGLGSLVAFYALARPTPPRKG